jgi:PP-loop superfamily ATP-utilizing enzyme
MLDAASASLRQITLADPRPSMVGFSGGTDSILVAHPVTRLP